MGDQGGDGADQVDPDPELVELASTESIGAHHGAAKDVHQRLVGRRIVQVLAKTDELDGEFAPDDVALGLVIDEKRPAADTHGGSDGLYGRLVEPVPLEELESHPGDMGTSGAGAATSRHLD